MASRHGLASSARCFSCQTAVLSSFIYSLLPPTRQRLPPLQTYARQAFTTSLRLRNSQDDPLKKDFPFEDAPDPVIKSEDAIDFDVGATAEPAPWYLEVQEQKDLQQAPANPFAERQRLPELPKNAPPILEALLKYVSVDVGLDYLTVLDLRDMNPPPALGSNLIMIFGTARSERHLNVSADRLCRWLRTTYKLRPFADGLLGRNELKLKLRRKNRRSKMLGAAGATDPGSYDDGIHTGWICVNVGAVDGTTEAPEAEPQTKRDDGFIGFGQQDDKPRIVVQMLTEEKRGAIELESLWKGAYDRALRKEKAQREAAGKQAHEADNVETDPEDVDNNVPSPNAARPYLPRAAIPRQHVRQLHTSSKAAFATTQMEDSVENLNSYELEPQIMHQPSTRINTTKAFPTPPTYNADESLTTQLDSCARALRTNIEYLVKLENSAAIRMLGTGETDRTSTAFLAQFYSNMPMFLETSHWQSLVSLHKYAMEIGHQRYTRQGLLKIMREMHASVGVISQDIFMDILYAMTRTQLVLYPGDGDAYDKPSTAEGALRRSLGLVFEVLEKMDAYGYNIMSDEVILSLHHAINHPKVVLDDSLQPYGQQNNARALQAPDNELYDKQDSSQSNLTDLPSTLQDKYNFKLRQAIKTLNPGPFSNRVYNALLETYGFQQHWKSFWSVWDDMPKNMVSRTAAMYITLFRASANAGSQLSAQRALRDAIPQMGQERPPVELKGDVAMAVGECLQVAQFDPREPFHESLKRRLELALNDHLLEQWAHKATADGSRVDSDDMAYGGSEEDAPTVR